jgi:predicted O-methyltransferase YrrM
MMPKCYKCSLPKVMHSFENIAGRDNIIHSTQKQECFVSEEQWSEVDDYITGKLRLDEPALDAALASNAANGLPPYDVSAPLGKFLHLLARMIGARRILEIGTLGGYSTIWLARALPAGGLVVSLEYDPHHAEVARANIARAGMSDRVDLRVGAALDTLPRLGAENGGPFDLIFIDADKTNNAAYLQWAVRLARPGSVIIGDNVVRDGEIVDAHSTDASVRGARALFDALAAEPRLSATALQTVGSKGWDGFAIALVE